MKLLLITSSFPKSGRIGGMFIPDTVKFLNKFGLAVHILTQNCDTAHTYSETLWPGCEVTYFAWKGRDVPLISLLGKGLPGTFLMFQYFINGFYAGRRICKSWKPDIVFAEWLIPAGIIARLLSIYSGIPYCCRALGSDVYQAMQNYLLKPVIKHVAKKSDLLFADGFDLCSKTSALAAGKTCHFAATARHLDNKTSNFSPHQDDNLYTFCCIGRLHKVKGQDVLIQACAALIHKKISFRCYLVGTGEEKENLEELIHDLSLQESVILTGKLEDGDITNLLQKADCVVIPSRSESIPMILMEAIAARKPLILSNVGDMGFLAEKYKLGYVVKAEDNHDLAEALIKMSNSKIRSSFYNKKNYEELASLLSVEAGAKVIYENIMRLQNKT
jgi:glycosyltransferase involved in cell wall biosynthesis